MDKIKDIIIDDLGFKITIVDYNKNAFILKFDISFTSMNIIEEFIGMEISNAIWIFNST